LARIAVATRPEPTLTCQFYPYSMLPGSFYREGEALDFLP